MRLNGVEALVVKHRLNETAGRGITIYRGDNIGTKSFAKYRLSFERVAVSLPYHARQIS